MMDSDGKNQRQITHYDSLSIEPALAPDGAKLAFVSYARGNPGIFLFSVNPIRDLRFYNQQGAGLSGQPSFAPDGRQIVFMSSVGGCCNIFSANLDGSGLRRITTSATINAEPKINPKNSDELAFVSGRSGPQQLYRMDIDGGGIERLTDGTGQASNPSWNPSGQTLAFAWTRGFEPGHWNIFLMDVASRRYQQLTHEEGRNENPSWGPDGAHLVFMSTRSGTPQIWTMLADGTHLKQLTTHGQNFSPVWGK
jgi:TolB protein